MTKEQLVEAMLLKGNEARAIRERQAQLAKESLALEPMWKAATREKNAILARLDVLRASAKRTM